MSEPAGDAEQWLEDENRAGRRAAARELSNLGPGIKISADGPISGFRRKEPVFTIS